MVVVGSCKGLSYPTEYQNAEQIKTYRDVGLNTKRKKEINK